MTTDEIFLLEDGRAHELPVRTMRQGILGGNLEDALQLLLERFPQVIPGRQIDPGAEDPPRFVLLRREAPLGAWSLDHLLVDQAGVLTLLECKLAQNAESRRDVIGQIIEYAANAKTAWGEGRLRDLANSYWLSRGRALNDVLKEAFELEDLEGFWSTVESNLEQGNSRLIVAGDEIRPEVRRMLEYLNEEMQHVEVLGLELRCYGSAEDRVVLVPTIIGQTQARVDRRKAGSERRIWSVSRLRESFPEWEDQSRAKVCARLLDWAEKTGSFYQSTAQNASFGIRSPTGRRLLYVYEREGLYIYTDSSIFSQGLEDLRLFIGQLKDANLLMRELDVMEGNKQWAKLSVADEPAVDQLTQVLESWIA